MTCSSVWLSSHISSKAMHDMLAHQLPQYYQPQRVPSMACTTLVTWYMHCKRAHIQTAKLLAHSRISFIQQPSYSNKKIKYDNLKLCINRFMKI